MINSPTLVGDKDKWKKKLQRNLGNVIRFFECHTSTSVSTVIMAEKEVDL